MKELSIEGKAKAYDEAIKKAKEQYDNYSNPVLLEYIFPELKESIDERIKTVIKQVLSESTTEKDECYLDNGVTQQEVFAWLEKQGKNNMGISEATKKKLEDNLDKALEKETPESWNKFLDEQGEQKPADKIQLGKKYKCIASPRYSTFTIGKIYKPEDKFLCSLMNFCSDCFELIDGEQNHTDKAEPKFHKGDWIINSQGTLRHIINVDKGGYQTDEGWLSHNTYEKTFHLWTIQDVKDGDVLCCENGWTCIFKALDNHTNTFSSYCFMDSYKWFCNIGVEGHTLDKAFIKAYNGDIHPATKEQRDLLFQKMKEAGYEWDSEKKELKKIEQKPAEWSVEDYNEIESIACHLDNTDNEDMEKVLRNIRNKYYSQSIWKPSDEQIVALESATENCAYSEYQDCLRELIGQLKKLKG